MAQPTGPLPFYLTAQGTTDAALRAILQDAAQEAESLIPKLFEKYATGASIRAAQLSLILRNIREMQAEMWNGIGQEVKAGMAKAALAAANAESVLETYLMQKAGVDIPELMEAMRFQAMRTVQILYANAAADIPLAEQVYRTGAVADGIVKRTVQKGILLGRSAKEIADSVRDLVNPATPGGVSYAAMRLGRTELNNSFHRAQIDLRKDTPWITGMKWNLSRSHPKPDECDRLAQSVHYKNGPAGVFRPMEVPPKPHPQCFCFLTSVDVGEDEFIDNLIDGKYNTYIDEKVYTYLPRTRTPC